MRPANTLTLRHTETLCRHGLTEIRVALAIGACHFKLSTHAPCTYGSHSQKHKYDQLINFPPNGVGTYPSWRFLTAHSIHPQSTPVVRLRLPVNGSQTNDHSTEHRPMITQQITDQWSLNRSQTNDHSTEHRPMITRTSPVVNHEQMKEDFHEWAVANVRIL